MLIYWNHPELGKPSRNLSLSKCREINLKSKSTMKQIAVQRFAPIFTWGIFLHSLHFPLFPLLHEQTLQVSTNTRAHGIRFPVMKFSWESIGLEEINEDDEKIFLPPSRSKNISECDFSYADNLSKERLTPLNPYSTFSVLLSRQSARNNIKVHYEEHKFIRPSVPSL